MRQIVRGGRVLVALCACSLVCAYVVSSGFDASSAVAAASGDDGPGGTVSVGAGSGSSSGGSPGVPGSGGQGGGASPWTCTYTLLTLNNQTQAPGGPTPGAWYSVTCVDSTTGAETTQTEWIPNQATAGAPPVDPYSLALQAERSIVLPDPVIETDPVTSVVNFGDLAMDRSRSLARLPGHRVRRTRECDRLRSAHFGDLEHGRWRFDHLPRTGSAVPARHREQRPDDRLLVPLLDLVGRSTVHRRESQRRGLSCDGDDLLERVVVRTGRCGWGRPAITVHVLGRVPSCRASRESRHVPDDPGSFQSSTAHGIPPVCKRPAHVVVDMTSLLDRSADREAERGSAEPERLLPTRPRSRRQLLAAASAVVIVTSIAGFMSLYSSARRQQQVVVVTRTIEQGQIFNSTDLGQANASLSNGVQAIPVSLTATLSGKRAAVTVPAGSLLVPGDVTSAPAIPPGEAVVGIALKDGQYPSTGVQPGGQVMVVQTASPGSPLSVGTTSGSSSASNGSESTTGTGVLVPEAAVFDVTTPGANAGGTLSELVSVEVPTTLAAAVSTAAAADQVSLVLLPDVASGTNGATGGGATSNGGGSS